MNFKTQTNDLVEHFTPDVVNSVGSYLLIKCVDFNLVETWRSRFNVNFIQI